MNTIDQTFYLVLSKKERGYGLSGRLTNKAPRLGAGEIVMELNVRVPRALFARPSLRAQLSIPEGTVPGPVISTDVADNIAAVIREQTGLRVEIAAADIREDR